MAKKKVYIPQFYKRDRDGMTALSRVGIARIEDLKKHCNLVDSRIKSWCRDGYAEKLMYKQGMEVKEAITLTKKGKELLEKQWNVRGHYHAQIQSPYHDLALSDKYFSLPEELRETWKTENQVREKFLEKLQEIRKQGDEEKADLYYKMMKDHAISMPDAVYKSETGVETAYEIITNSYGRQEMLAKETTVEIMQYSYETNRI